MCNDGSWIDARHEISINDVGCDVATLLWALTTVGTCAVVLTAGNQGGMPSALDRQRHALVGQQVSFLSDSKSSLGDAKSSLGDAKSSLAG